ncbi:MAG: hypothetical protein RIS76_956 [Verrucomicrobiota bacterium]
MRDAVEVLSGPSLFQKLEPEWRTLFRESPRAHLTSGLDWCRINWETVAADRFGRLLCLSIRRAGRPVLIWPLVQSRFRGLWRQVQPLATLSTEYSHPLVADVPDAGAIVSEALRRLRGLGDLVLLPMVRGDSELHEQALQNGAFHVLHSTPTSGARMKDWASYEASVDTAIRNELSRRQRRLAEQGSVVLSHAVNSGDSGPAMEWILEHKRRWLTSTGRTSPWLATEAFRRQMLTAAAQPWDSSGLVVSTLTLNGRILSAKVLRIDQTRVEFVLTGMDPAYRRFSPSLILWREQLRWACEHGREVDFRIGQEDYKEAWANCHGQCHVIRGAVSRWGQWYTRLHSAWARRRR